jgi:hypothetical protein
VLHRPWLTSLRSAFGKVAQKASELLGGEKKP